MCETLLEIYTMIESQLDEVLNSITFARLKIIHPSVIGPRDLMSQLSKISQSLQKNNLPLVPTSQNIGKYFDIIELQAYQTYERLVFVLKIPIVEPESYNLFHMYSIPVIDKRTKLFHILLTSQKYLAVSDDTQTYTSLNNLNNCKVLDSQYKLCPNLITYTADNTAICEVKLLRNPDKLPDNCQVSVIYSDDYNVQRINENMWLIAATQRLPVTISCPNMTTQSHLIEQNYILTLTSTCTSYIGTTRVQASNKFSEITRTFETPNIPFNCCDHLPEHAELPKLQPLKISKLNLDELNIAEHKLNQYNKELDDLINEPFIVKHTSWFTYAIIVVICSLVILYFIRKCKKIRSVKVGIINGNDNPPRPPDQPAKPLLLSRLRDMMPQRRQALRRVRNPQFEEESELTELNLNLKTTA